MSSKKLKRPIIGKADNELANSRLHMGERKEDVLFPVAPATLAAPASYAALLSALKERIRGERLRVVMAGNSALVLLYWDIGQSILNKQRGEGWGAKVIDRLSADLSKEFPDMKGFSPRNLKYMRAFASAWPEKSFVQAALAQITWYHNITLLDKLKEPLPRIWYARKAAEHGWSRNVLVIQIETRAHEREGKAVNNFPAALPPADSDMARQIFKDPYLFDFLGTADTRRGRN